VDAAPFSGPWLEPLDYGTLGDGTSDGGWLDDRARYPRPRRGRRREGAVPPALLSEPTLSVSKAARTRVAEASDRMAPWASGLLVGTLGGGLAIGLLGLSGAQMVEGGATLARALFHDRVHSDAAAAAVFALAALSGGVGGAAFAGLTRHLRRFVPLLIFSVVFWLSVVTAAFAFVLSPLVPAFVSQVPYGAACIASIPYAVLLSCALPLRQQRRAPRGDVHRGASGLSADA
jgi:hypothetical protein